MSGGHYDYAYFSLQGLAEDILEDCSIFSEAEDIRFSMQVFAEKLLKMSEVARMVEWYMSGDIGEDTLRECFKEWEKTNA